jgi:hypothetical protein
MPSLSPAKPNTAALAALARRRLMPTTLGTRELQALGREVLEHSQFSAKTANESLLRRQRKAIADLLNPEAQAVGQERLASPTSARVALKEMLREIGYVPGTTGPVGSVEDLASDARIDLILRTNTQVLQGSAERLAGLGRTDEFPALELIRLERKQQERPWADRWMQAGQASGRAYGDGWGLFAGRMMALKDHPIWERLGDPALFDDGLGNPYPPFAFNSGMWTDEVSLADAMDAGLV